MSERRVLMLSGPRQCGKTTLARQLESDRTEYRTLDDGTLHQAAQIDPGAFVKRTAGTLIIDEVQRVPALLPAIKQAVDENTRPGQYLLTGSADIRSLPTIKESLAGRVAAIRLRPLAQGEIMQRSPAFIDAAFDQSFPDSPYRCDRDALLEMAFRGGFPEPMVLNGRGRHRWHIGYVNAILDRDLQDISRIQRKNAMRQLIHTLAAWTGRTMDLSAIGAGLSIRRPTIETYINALETLYLVERVEPWTKTDYSRVGKQRRLYMSDSGLAAALLNWKIEQVRLDADRCGKIVETFAYNEIMAHVEAADGRFDLYHYRDREKREIDFIIEREDNAVLGIEIKAGSSVDKKDFRHLEWFRDSIAPDRSFTGIVLYTGEFTVSFGRALWAVPFGAIWA